MILIHDPSRMVQELQIMTMEKIRLCSSAESMKMLITAHDILSLTDNINKIYNKPPKEKLICDWSALVELREKVLTAYLYNDPNRMFMEEYVSKVKMLIHLYRVGFGHVEG